jgi:hypothetical protein
VIPKVFLAQEDQRKIMRDEDRTEEQLLEELVVLRRRVAKLEGLLGQRRRSQTRSQKIGEILIEMGHVTESQLEEALRKQREAILQGGDRIPVGRILIASGAITGKELRDALDEQLARLRNSFRRE